MYGDDMLEIDMDSKYGILFVRLFGELTKRTRKKLNNEVGELIKNVGILNVVFNLENVNIMDDSGFKTLVKYYNMCNKNHGNSIICLSKNKFNVDLKKFNVVSDELSAVRLVNLIST